MNNFKQKCKNSLMRIYRNSYGMDELNRAIIYAALGFALLNMFLKSQIIYFIYMFLDFFFIFRFISKKKFARAEENRKYRKIKKFVSVAWANRKTHKVFPCHKCGQIIRVPKGKGKIEVTCPNCGIIIETKS